MTEQPRLLPPSAGLQVCIRRLLEARPESIQETHAILKRTWPRIDYATADLAFAHYLDATTPAEPEPSPPVVVTSIGRGRIVDDDQRGN